MSILSIFKSGIFNKSKSITAPISLVKGRNGEAERDLKQVALVSTIDTAAIIATATATAQAQAREIIISAKDEAFKVKDQALKDARIQLEEPGTV
ncbi:MAG: hypothetical protein UW84_C0051G0011 [Candidatus Collierbacteria bacterium GW2011_GWA2_44_99]|uniref:Uncharacterized protein n=1 Tax=Candidatus Collierbacteria bacterium GW2011_GWA2_44_99 TaxID=1618380 RepID=A0A0G1MVC4_9BACT|nr:MAG: hypothetical protein UW84_C0051G0011 [Candidatus Collierbacteria bacterium GW2011_GWA2_44_99]